MHARHKLYDVGMLPRSWSDGRRLCLAKHQGLQHAMTEAPDFAFKLLGDVLAQSVLEKEAEKSSEVVRPAITGDPSCAEWRCCSAASAMVLPIVVQAAPCT